MRDSIELIELGEEEGDTDIVKDAEAALKTLSAEAARRQVEAMLSGEADSNDTYLEVHSGAGGTESQDWANMLLRMYTRWAERQGFKVELMEIHDGEEAGIKSATLLVKGQNAYGWLKTESGVHRLVRISPMTAMRGATPRSRPSGSIRSSTIRSRSTSTKATAGSIPIAPRRWRSARQHHRLGRADHAYPSGIVVQCQQERSSTRTGPRPGTCCAPGSTKRS